MSAFDWANQSCTGPASVEPKRYRYLPPLSKTGSVTSLKPSVMAIDLSCSSEYANTVFTSGWVFDDVGQPLRVGRPVEG